MSEKIFNLDLGKKMVWLEIQRVFFGEDCVLSEERLGEIMDLSAISQEPILPGLTKLSPYIINGLSGYFKIPTLELIEAIESLVEANYFEISESFSLIQGSKSIALLRNKPRSTGGKCADFTQNIFKLLENKPTSNGLECAEQTQNLRSRGYRSSLSSLIFKGGVGGKTIAHEFDELWNLWPKKKDRERALVNYRRVRRSHGLEEIEKSVDGYLSFLKSQRIHKHFEQESLYLSTFLNKNRWKEYLGESYEPSL